MIFAWTRHWKNKTGKVSLLKLNPKFQKNVECNEGWAVVHIDFKSSLYPTLFLSWMKVKALPGSMIGCIRCPGPTSDHSWLDNPGAAFRQLWELSTGRRSRRIPGICGSGCQSFIPLSPLRLRLMLRWSDQSSVQISALHFGSQLSPNLLRDLTHLSSLAA